METQGFYCYIESPLGRLTATGDDCFLHSLTTAAPPTSFREQPDSEVFAKTRRWLRAYFAGEPLPEPPPLHQDGTVFQQAVWQKLMEIPRGEAVSYGDIARALNSSPRAVGGAVGKNAIWILRPCHRVLGTGGQLTGFTGGLAIKRALLELEGIPYRADS